MRTKKKRENSTNLRAGGAGERVGTKSISVCEVRTGERTTSGSELDHVFHLKMIILNQDSD